MPRNRNGKLKILYVKDLLEQASREGRLLFMRDLIEQLNVRGISAERKSVQDDLEALKAYGLPIDCKRCGRACGYFLHPNA